MKEIEEMTLKMKQEKLDALKNTAVGKRAFADITNEVCGVLRRSGSCLTLVFRI